MHFMTVISLVISLTFVAHAAFAKGEGRVVTHLPVTEALTTSLTQDTAIEVAYLPPKRLPVKRISSWLRNKSGDVINQAAAAKAVVTVESVWPETALYGKLRSKQITIIPIDIAHEMNEPGSSVRLNTEVANVGDYFWLSTDNLLVMSQVLARDLSRIWPEHAKQIHLNQQKLRTQMQTFALTVDQLLLDNQVSAICLIDSELSYLAEATFLPIEQKDECQSSSLKVAKAKRNSQPEQLSWLLNPLEKPSKMGLQTWLQENLTSLQNALSSKA